MRAGYSILLYLIHHLVITNVYAQSDAEKKSYQAADTILLVSIIVGSVILALVLTFMCCPNFLCCCCPDCVRYCCIGYPQEKTGYVRQTQSKRQDGYINRKPNEKNQRVHQNSIERKGLLDDRSGVRQGNIRPTSGGIQGNQQLNERVEYVPVQYQPLPVVENVQMPPTVAPYSMAHQYESSTLYNPYAPAQVTLTPGPCPPSRYSLPMMPVRQNEILLPPSGQPPVIMASGEVVHELPNQVLHEFPNQVQH
jgi:hypothetical protein